MGGFKKPGGFNRGGNQGQGFNRRGPSDRPRFGGGSGGFSRSENTGSRDGSHPQMFSAVCSECNRACEVPFRPTGDRPVFCRDCFGGKRGSSQSSNPRTQKAEQSSYDGNPRRDFPRRDFTPSAPSSKPPVEDKRIDDLKRQLDTVNKKLDAMMEMMKVVPAQKVKATREPEERSSHRMMATREHRERSSRRMTAKKSVKVKK